MGMKSALGYQLQRLEQFSTDSEGNPIRHRKRGDAEVPVKETRNAPNSTMGLEDREDASHLQARLDRAIGQLSRSDQDVMKLQEAGEWFERDERLTVEEAAHLRPHDPNVIAIGKPDHGYRLVRRRYWRSLSHVQIAERLGITPRQVHSAIARINSARREAAR